MSGRYGRMITFFETFARYVWFPASHSVFTDHGSEPISTEVYNLQAARLAVRAYQAKDGYQS